MIKLAALESAGLISRSRRKGKTERGALTPRRAATALDFLGSISSPQAKPTWASLKKIVPGGPRRSGLPRRTRRSARQGRPRLQGRLLKAQYDLPLDDYPTFDQAEALAWTKSWGSSERESSTSKTVKAA